MVGLKNVGAYDLRAAFLVSWASVRGLPGRTSAAAPCKLSFFWLRGSTVGSCVGREAETFHSALPFGSICPVGSLEDPIASAGLDASAGSDTWPAVCQPDAAGTWPSTLSTPRHATPLPLPYGGRRRPGGQVRQCHRFLLPRRPSFGLYFSTLLNDACTNIHGAPELSTASQWPASL